MQEPFIGVDWGSSSFRAALISGNGVIGERREAPIGAASLAPGDFEDQFERLVGDWRAQGHSALLCGMVGARRGWLEAPYVECPTPMDGLATNLMKVDVDGPDVMIVPGCLYRCGDTVEVMRGEETQILGAGLIEGTACLPGTHTKWASVYERSLIGFATALTGELFALLRQHSSLGQLMTEGCGHSTAFDRGVDESADASRLLYVLFQTRSRVLAGTMAAGEAADYLSGLLIGADCRGAFVQGEVSVIGMSKLAQRYSAALSRLGVASRRADDDAAFRGLYLLYRDCLA